MVIDLGTGSGQAVLRAAGRQPETVVIGVDPDVAALRQASHAAARPVRRGGLPNAIFLAAGAEALPGLLAGRADSVTIALPWGSLLRGLLTADQTLLARIAALLKPGAELELLLSTLPADNQANHLATERDALRLAQRHQQAGLRTVECRPSDSADVVRLSSAWGRRLGIPERRPGWIIRLGNGSGGPGVTAPTTEEVLESGVR